jgi:hypothetical protein
VEILEEHKQRLDLAFPEQQPFDGLQDPLPALGRVEGGPCIVVDRDIQQRQQRCQQWLQRAVQRQQLARHAFADFPLAVAVLDLEIRIQELDDGQVRCGSAIGDRAAFEDQPAVGAVRLRELPEQPRFPHPGLAHDGDGLPVPGDSALERLCQLLQLTRAPDKAGQASGRRRLEARPHGPHSAHLIGLHRLAQSFNVDWPQRFDLQVTLGQAQGLGCHQDRPWHRYLFHARREMGRLPHRRVVHVQVAPDGPHDHFSRVQPDADVDGNAVRALHLLGVAPDGLLHPERRIAGANRMVFMRERRPEQRHDPVAHHLVDGTLVVMDGLHHAFHHRIEKLPRLLGIAVGEQLHRPLQVGEQHRDLFALAL